MINQIPGTIILCRIPETINFWINALATTKINAQEHWLSVKCNSSIVQGPGSKNWRASHMNHTVHHLISWYFQLHQVHSWSGRINYHHFHGNSERHQLTYAIPPWTHPCWGCNNCWGLWSTCLSSQIRGSPNEWYMWHWCSWSQFII